MLYERSGWGCALQRTGLYLWFCSLALFLVVSSISSHPLVLVFNPSSSPLTDLSLMRLGDLGGVAMMSC
jgi:hypothetical protein